MISLLGKTVSDFEEALASYLGVKHVQQNSATSCLHVAYQIIELKSGDEIITTPFDVRGNIQYRHSMGQLLYFAI